MSEGWGKAIEELRGLVRDEVAAAFASNVTPGVYTSLTVGTDGRIRHGTASLSAMRPAWMAMLESSQTITTSTSTFSTVNWNVSTYWTTEGSATSTGGWHFNGVRTQVYLATGYLQITPGSGWGPGNPRVRVTYTRQNWGVNNLQTVVAGAEATTVGLTLNLSFAVPFKATTDPIAITFSQNGGVSVGITGAMMLLAGPEV